MQAGVALDRDYLRWTPSGAQFTVVQLTKTRTPGPLSWYIILHYQRMLKYAQLLFFECTFLRQQTELVQQPLPSQYFLLQESHSKELAQEHWANGLRTA